MLGAIYIGLSGMNAFSRGLQTISNNVANLNTSGYKASSVSFTDAFNVGGLGAAYSGRRNQNYGAGVRFGSPAVDFTQGDMRQSGGDLDLAIQGNGFLVLSDKTRTDYARTGQFVVGDDGFITLSGTDYRLNLLDPSGQLSLASVDKLRLSPPTVTSNIAFGGNLSTNPPSSGSADAVVSDIPVYDARGTRHVWKVTFKRVTDSTQPGLNKWTVDVDDETSAVFAQQSIQFGPGGTITNPSTLTFSYTSENGEPLEVKLDLKSVSSFSGGASNVTTTKVDGNGVGNLTSVTVTKEGQVRLTYSNSKTEDIGAVALADFRDQQKLERLGDGLFRNNGETARLLTSGKDGMGTLVSKQIEASNVDLSQQFGDLILIQRGFQASSQVVSISNDMIQQLFGIRGQS
jgi:flagellar hook protein FlgE